MIIVSRLHVVILSWRINEHLRSSFQIPSMHVFGCLAVWDYSPTFRHWKIIPKTSEGRGTNTRPMLSPIDSFQRSSLLCVLSPFSNCDNILLAKFFAYSSKANRLIAPPGTEWHLPYPSCLTNTRGRGQTRESTLSPVPNVIRHMSTSILTILPATNSLPRSEPDLLSSDPAEPEMHPQNRRKARGVARTMTCRAPLGVSWPLQVDRKPGLG